MDELAERMNIVQFFRTETDFDQMPVEAWELVDRGLTLGVFQIEEGTAAKRLAKKIKARSIHELAVMSALNRPGPLRSGDTDRYVARRNGTEDITYPHAILESILEPTLGVIAFQEQCINYFVAIGYTLSEADHMRKIIGKKLVDEMQAELPRYTERAEQHMPKASATRIWRLIENYSKYGFNEAHAVGYATITAWTIYAKYMWPVEFYMASIETNPKKVGAYVNEAKRRDIAVLGPDVNESSATISKVDKVIRYGIVDIKGVGLAAAKQVVKEQPYRDHFDYFARCKANMGVMKKLNAAGAFDSWGYRLEECPTCEGKGKVRVEVPTVKGDRMKLISEECAACLGWAWSQCVIPTPEVRAKLEEELLGIGLTDLHGAIIKRFAKTLANLDSYEAVELLEKETAKVPGIITQVTSTKVRPDAKRNAGRAMGHATIQWQGEELKFVAFCDAWDEYAWALKANNVGEFTLQSHEEGARLSKVKLFV